MRKRIGLIDVVQELCSQIETSHTRIDDRTARVMLETKTSTVNTGIFADHDNSGFEYFTPLINLKGQKDSFKSKLARVVMDNPPPRELSHVFRNDTYGIVGTKSQLPFTREGVKRSILDAFGRVSRFVDNDFPNIKYKLDKD